MERRPPAVPRCVGQVRDHHLGVEMRIAGAGRPMTERDGHDEALASTMRVPCASRRPRAISSKTRAASPTATSCALDTRPLPR